MVGFYFSHLKFNPIDNEKEWVSLLLFLKAISLVSIFCLEQSLDLDMVIDIHAHASLMGTFIYGNAYDDVYR